MNYKSNHFSLLSIQLFRLFAMLGIFLVLTFLYRLIFLFYYGSNTGWQKYLNDLPFGFFQGMRLDAQTSLYFLLPLLIFAVLSGIFGRRIFSILGQIWSGTALVIYSALLIVDFFYYQFFGSHFSVSAFGIIDDDTQAVLQSIWEDYPAVRVILFFLIISVALVFVTRWIHRLRIFEKLSAKRFVSYLSLLIFPASVLLMRGSIGVFPLRNYDAFVSENNFINAVCVNPVLSLKDAYASYKSSNHLWDADKMLHDAGYTSAAQAVAEYLNIPADSIQGDPLDYLLCTTDDSEFLSDNPPHVVFLQMESMGLNALSLQSDNIDILGTLKEELEYCMYFPNFLSHTLESTIGSLEGIIISNVSSGVAQSVMNNKPILSSITRPFKNAGYETRFVTGAKQGWRNVNVFLQAQGFDFIEGKEAIMHDIPDAEIEDWGVFDEYMFMQILNDLQYASAPQFIYGMSITNHSPYRLPRGYTCPEMIVDDRLKKRLLNDEEYTRKGLSVCRYANDCLGNFIHAIRYGPLADKVIIAISGDHPFKGFFKPDDEKPYDKHGVPFILYIPEPYLKNKKFDIKQRGAHRDIFPTLFHLALSNASYYNLGKDMLTETSENRMAISPSNIIITDEGAINLQTEQFYKNHNDSVFVLHDDAALSQSFIQRYNVWMTVCKYIILRSVEPKQ
ncbi:MAG: sulfatase-like hydrolase/transferase [Prevotellaceae bacterium]|jgi:phosphoglycerol transferase MdoB-like AlkP superfamily enzyme|nr:sulfatase-like hydrolase/transferase [Prevotellaceae bacterium]